VALGRITGAPDRPRYPGALAKRLKRTLKVLHEVGSAGLTGAAVTQLVLSHRAEGLAPTDYATMRAAILAVSEWLLMPSLVIVLMSGLAAMAVHHPFQRAGWALTKLATTVLVFEGTLFAVQGPTQVAARLAREIAAGDPSKADVLAETLRHERGGLWVILVLCLVNIALAVYRPRFRKARTPPASPDETTESDEGEQEEEEDAEPVASPG